MEHLLNELFAVVLAVTPWAAVLILLLLGLRRFAKRRLSPRFFQLAFLILAVRLALPFDLSIEKAPVQAPLPTPVRQVIETPVLPEVSIEELVESGPAPLPMQPEIPPQAEEKQKWEIAGIMPLVWLAGAVSFLGLHLASYGIFRVKLCKNRQRADEEACLLAQQAFRKPIDVWVSDKVPGPMLMGFFKPAVYLPAGGVQTQNLPYILAHEACHARRLDLPAQFLLLAAQSIHWFNPLVHQMARAAREDMERGCDEAVLAGQDLDYRKAYGSAVLASLAAARHQRVMNLSTGFSEDSDMRHRFEEMFNFAKKKRGLPLLALVAVLVAAASSLIAVTPRVLADKKQEQEEPVFAESFVSEQDTEEVLPQMDTHWVLEPTQEFKITAKFGDTSFENVHLGVDLATEEGAFVLSAEDGKVIEAGKDFTSGNYIKVETANGNVWMYAQCQKTLAEQGQTVKAGQPIALVGNTGMSTGSHLHLELTTPSGHVDPLTVLNVPSAEDVENAPLLLWPVPDYQYVIRKMSHTHGGDDIAAKAGSEILAAQAGEVVTAGDHWSYGKYVIIKGSNGYSTLYAHCSELLVQEGEMVAQGQPIAKVGCTGQVTGNHLHLELRHDEKRMEAMDHFAEIKQ